MPHTLPQYIKPLTRAERLASLPELLTRKDVMTFLGVLSRGTLRNMIALGKFPPPIAINQRLHRWRREDVAAWHELNGSWTHQALPADTSDDDESN